MDTVIAKIELTDASDWSDETKKAVALWLRRQGDRLRRESWNYHRKFSAKYITRDG